MNPVNNSDIREHRAQGASTIPDAVDLAAEQSPVLELRGISCAYEPNRPAVEQITFTVHQGEILCLLGPSGCGKTTILRAIAGFEQVTDGSISLSGRLVSSREVRGPTEQRRIGMGLQE